MGVENHQKALKENTRADILERFMDNFQHKLSTSDPGMETLWQKSELHGSDNWRSYWYNYQEPFPQRPKHSKAVVNCTEVQGPEFRDKNKWRTCWWNTAGSTATMSA